VVSLGDEADDKANNYGSGEEWGFDCVGCEEHECEWDQYESSEDDSEGASVFKPRSSECSDDEREQDCSAVHISFNYFSHTYLKLMLNVELLVNCLWDNDWEDIIKRMAIVSAENVV